MMLIMWGHAWPRHGFTRYDRYTAIRFSIVDSWLSLYTNSLRKFLLADLDAISFEKQASAIASLCDTDVSRSDKVIDLHRSDLQTSLLVLRQVSSFHLRQHE